MSSLTGFDDLNRRLLALGDPKKIKKVAKSAVVAGQRVIVKGIKAKIPGRYKEARKTVGNSFKRLRHGEDAGSVSAKAGLAVGKKMPGREQAEATSAHRRAAGRKGVGISARNIHWLVLGTIHTRGTPPLAGIVQAGVSASSAEAAQKIKQKLAEGIAREARR